MSDSVLGVSANNAQVIETTEQPVCLRSKRSAVRIGPGVPAFNNLPCENLSPGTAGVSLDRLPSDDSVLVLSTEQSESVVIPIILNERYHALVDAEDYDRVSAIRWHPQIDGAGRIYALGWSGKAQIRMHRFIMEAKPGDRIDHRDGDGLHNWKANLRRATNAQNIRNSRPYCGRKLKGVSFLKDRGVWRAQIMCCRQKINLGNFTTAEEAARCYDENARKLFGEFARLNFPERTA